MGLNHLQITGKQHKTLLESVNKFSNSINTESIEIFTDEGYNNIDIIQESIQKSNNTASRKNLIYTIRNDYPTSSILNSNIKEVKHFIRPLDRILSKSEVNIDSK